MRNRTAERTKETPGSNPERNSKQRTRLEALDEKIRQSIKDYENGNVFRMKEDESVSDFVNRLVTHYEGKKYAD